MRNFGTDSGWKQSAGLIAFWFDHGDFNYCFHFIVQKEHWIWGFEDDYYDGPIKLFGMGPLFLVCKMWAY